jgi:hypothetical protein
MAPVTPQGPQHLPNPHRGEGKMLGAFCWSLGCRPTSLDVCDDVYG